MEQMTRLETGFLQAQIGQAEEVLFAEDYGDLFKLVASLRIAQAYLIDMCCHFVC